MLNVMRDNFKNQPWLKGLLILVALSLILYLGSYFFSEPAAGADLWAARIDGETAITQGTFLRAAQEREGYWQEVLGDQYPQFRAQVMSDLLRSMAQRELIIKEANKMGLYVTDAELAEFIQTYPAHLDQNGNFMGTELYEQAVLRNYRGGVSAYEAQFEGDLLTDKWRETLAASIQVPDADVEQAWRDRNEKTAIDYVLVRSQDMPDEEASDSELRAWYDSHLDDYLESESREVRYVVFERQAMAEKAEITDDEIEAHYELNQTTYARPEERKVSHILFPVEQGADQATRDAARAQAEQALQRASGGGDFAALARELSKDPDTAGNGGDLGYINRSHILANQAWQTGEGQVGPVTQTVLGFHVFQVTGLRDAGPAPLEEVRPEIVETLKLRRADELAREEAQAFSDSLENGDGFSAAAEKAGLEVTTATMAQGEPDRDLRPSPEFTSTIFTLEDGAVSRPLQVLRGMSVATIDQVIDAKPAPFDEVKTDVTVDLLNQKLKDAALATAERAHERHGSDLDAVARQVSRDVVSSGDLVRGQRMPNTGGNTPELEEALFGRGVAVGATGAVRVPAGALIYKVTSRQEFDSTAFETGKAALMEELVTNRLRSVEQAAIGKLNERYNTELNLEVLARFQQG